MCTLSWRLGGTQLESVTLDVLAHVCTLSCRLGVNQLETVTHVGVIYTRLHMCVDYAEPWSPTPSHSFQLLSQLSVSLSGGARDSSMIYTRVRTELETVTLHERHECVDLQICVCVWSFVRVLLAQFLLCVFVRFFV